MSCDACFSRDYNDALGLGKSTKYKYIVKHFYVIGLQSYRIPRNNAKLGLLRSPRSYLYMTSDCVIAYIGTNRKSIYDFLLLINTNWHPILYRFEVIADCCLNFGPKRSDCVSRGEYAVHLRLTSKAIIDFLFVLIDFFRYSYYG